MSARSEWAYLPDDKLRQLVMNHVTEQHQRFDGDKERIAGQQQDLQSFRDERAANPPPLSANVVAAERIAQQAMLEAERATFQLKSVQSLLQHAVQQIKSLEDRVNYCEDENRSLTLQIDALREHVLRKERAEANSLDVQLPQITSLPQPPPPPAAPTSSALTARDEGPTAGSTPLAASATLRGIPAKETVCDQCFSRAMCTACRNCESEWYCSVNCQVLRQEMYRQACGMLREKRLKRLQMKDGGNGPH